MIARHEANTDNPENPDDYCEDHCKSDVEGFRKVFLDIFKLDSNGGDKDDEEDNVKEGEYMILSLVLTKRDQRQPLHSNDNLHEYTEKE